MKEGWAKPLWLARKIDDNSQLIQDKVQAVISTLTNITLQVKGKGEKLSGTEVRVEKDGEVFTATFTDTLVVSFQLPSLGTYSITYTENLEDGGKVKTVTIDITEYGFYSYVARYFPGYDMWDYWCELADVDPSYYTDIEDLLGNSSIVTILMNTNDAVDYMMVSTQVIRPAVLRSKIATQAMVRSTISLKKVKADMEWRQAIIANSAALGYINACSDVIKIKQLNVPDTGTQGESASGQITDENALLIYKYVYLSSRFWGFHDKHGYNYNVARVYANGIEVMRLGLNTGTPESGNYLSIDDDAYAYNTSLADVITSMSLSISRGAEEGETGGSAEGKLYYI